MPLLANTTLKPDWLIGWVHWQDAFPMSGMTIFVAELTPGSEAPLGSGWSASTKASKPWADTNRGSADSVRRPAAAAASTRPPTRLIRIAIASQDRHRRRSSARNASPTAPKSPSYPNVAGQCDAPRGEVQGGQPVGGSRASTSLPFPGKATSCRTDGDPAAATELKTRP